MTCAAPLPFAAALPEKPGLLESLGYQLNGLIVVFLALASIWLALELIGRFFRRTAPAPVAAPAPAPVAAPAADPGSIPPEVVAVITAAVHVVCGERVAITAIAPVPSTMWAQDGRRQIFASHQPR